MSVTRTVRVASAADVGALAAVLDTIELFPSAMLEEMIAPFLADGSDDLWLVVGEEDASAEDGGESGALGLAFCEPERMTDGTFNLLALGVRADRQGEGLASAMIDDLESRLRSNGGRVLIVETSGLPEYETVRGLYERRGFTRQATIPEFYAAGEDKVVFWKKLAPDGRRHP